MLRFGTRALPPSSSVLAALALAASTLGAGPWETGDTFRARPLDLPAFGRSGFTRLPPETTGVRFTNQLSDARLAANQVLEVGSGVALGDFDGDGWVDLYFCALEGGNRLYRNLGNWRFADATTPLLACPGQFSTGAVFADVDGDGDLDLLVNGIGSGTRLFLNDGSGRFQERLDSGLVRQHGATSMALADVDGDGFLDLYAATYHTRTFKDSPPGLNVEAGYVGGQFVIKPPGLFLPLHLKNGSVNLFERGEPDFFYHNNGNGTFSALSWTNGIFLDAAGRPLTEPPKDWGLAVAFRDLNGDGRPDIYVCNDFFNSPDQIWLNDGSGRFRAAPATMLRHTSMSSMAIDFADINRDGRTDFLVLDMMSRDHARRQRQRGSQIHLQVETPVRDPAFVPEYPRNMLYLNRGDGTYAEIAQFAGLEASEWSWSVAFLDIDLDGYEDVLITNGNLRNANDADLGKNRPPAGKPRFPPLRTANLAFRNQRDLTFREMSQEWGFDELGISHGMALGDLDNDGDLDLVVNNMRAGASLYRNESTARRVAVRAIGKAPNVQGIGATVELLGGPVPKQSEEVMSGGRYLSGDDPMRVFAAGTNAAGMTLRVAWRDGTETRIEHVRPNYLYEVRQTVTHKVTPEKPEQPFFEDVTARLKHPHQENSFDDLALQPTLTRQFSRLGPGIAWRDLDQDGSDDLIVGGAKGGFGVVYLNDGKGGFKPLRRREPLPAGQTTVLAFADANNALQFVAGLSQYEQPNSAHGAVVRYDLQSGAASDLLPAQTWSAGPLSLGFLGQKLALFVGGRVKPGHYPENAGALLLVQENGRWKAEAPGALSSIGRASGATWADMDQDGQVELIVACDWGPIRVFRWNGNSLDERTAALGLEKFLGLWNGVSAGDFDGDGKLDIIASNWGRNTRYERDRARPLRLYYGNLQGFGQTEMLEAYYEPSQNRYVPFAALDTLRNTCPALAEKFATFEAYASAGIDAIAGTNAAFLESNCFESTVFLNRGDHFEAHPLPPEAQFAPAFGIAVGDLDGDGHEDAFLAQNFFDVEPETSRYDAGRGLWLRGDGNGNFTAVPGQESGVLLYGEQRGAALADFDRDGRIDLAVGQNNGAAALFRNVRARPGLRVRLQGPPWNPDAVGAVIRVKTGDRWGAARAIQIGSGYWSQESTVQIVCAESVQAISVRWPGGRTGEYPVSENQREITIR